jgi:hypothetical protein
MRHRDRSDLAILIAQAVPETIEEIRRILREQVSGL